MKKAIIFLSVALVALAACNKYEKDVETTPSDNAVTFNVSVSNADDTKAVKNAWADGDKIYVFFEGLAAKWLVLTYNGSTWAAVPSTAISPVEFSSLGTKKLTAVHTPADVTVAWDGSANFTFTDNSTNTIKPIYNYYLLEEDKEYTVDGTTVNVTLAMGKPANYVWFFVDGISADVDQYYLKEPNLTPTAPASVALTGGVTEVTKTTGYPIAGVALSTGGIYAGKVGAQTTYGFQLVKVHDATDMIATRTYTKAGTKTFAAGNQYNLGLYTDMTENQWVDLGYASNNVLWATGNLTDTDDWTSPTGGKGSILEYSARGEYYAYADLVGREDASTYAFSFDNTRYNNGVDGYTKYGEGATLEAADDAARYQLGGTWRIPTSPELGNLINNIRYNGSTYSRYNSVTILGPNGFCLYMKNGGSASGSSIASQSIFARYGSSTTVNNNSKSYQAISIWVADDTVPGTYYIASTTIPTNRYVGYLIRPVQDCGY